MEQLRVDMEGALDAVRRAVKAAGVRPAIPVVGITGHVGSGKSTLARLLTPCVLSTDDYLPDYENVPETERDEPRHADFDLLVSNIRQLRDGRAVDVPVWSFQTHRREGFRRMAPGELIVVEGIHALHDPLVTLMHVAIFVEAPRHVRWARWAEIESCGERGWGVEKARVFFDTVAEPTFERLAPAYRARAHLIVENAGPSGDAP